MIASGLSLDQAPPPTVPFRFFLAAPLFGVLAGIFLLSSAPEAFTTRWSAETLVFTHLFVLGFFLTIIMGALFQVLPVLAGVTIRHIQPLSRLIFVFHIIGTLGLCYDFVNSNFVGVVAIITLSLLVLSILTFVVITLVAMTKARAASDSVLGIRLSVIGLLITLFMGLLLVGGHSGMPLPFFRPELTNLHLKQGLIGTIFILIASVSYQVIPMFYVSPSYPKWMRKTLAPLTFTLVILNLILTSLRAWPVSHFQYNFFQYILILPIALFCIVTLRLLGQRRRKNFDASIWFWRSALFLTLASLACWPLGKELWVGVLALLAILALIFGMQMKILPFLVWFHLQSRYAKQAAAGKTPGFKVPHMKAIITDVFARTAYGLFLISAVFLCSFSDLWCVVFYCSDVFVFKSKEKRAETYVSEASTSRAKSLKVFRFYS